MVAVGVAGEYVGIDVIVVLAGVCGSQQVFHDEALQPSSFFRSGTNVTTSVPRNKESPDQSDNPHKCVHERFVSDMPPASESLPNPWIHVYHAS